MPFWRRRPVSKWTNRVRIGFAIGLVVAPLCVSGAGQAETVQIDNQRGEKVKFCTYRSDDPSLVRPRQCWMIRPGGTIQWQRGEDDLAFDVRLFEPGAFELPICLKRDIHDSYKVEIAPRRTKACVKSFERQSVPAQQWQRLDRVLVNWSSDRFWYPATIVNVPKNGYRVRLDDGRVVQTKSRYISDLSITPGVRVEVNWKGQGRWYPGYVKFVQGDMVDVQFDDGFEENSALRRVRLDLAGIGVEE